MKLKGFTLVELLIVIAVIAILAAVIYVAVDPATRFAQARNADRWSSVNSVLNAYIKYMVDNDGAHPVTLSDDTYYMIGTAAGTCSAQSTGTNFIDLSGLTTKYIAEIPHDPELAGSEAYTNYYVQKDTNGRITIGSCDAELGEDIKVTR